VKGECTQSSQVGLSNVSTRLSPVLVIDGVDVDKTVRYITLLSYGIDKGGEREIGAHNTIVCWPRIVLDLLDEHDVWSVQILRNVIGDDRDMSRVRSHILHLADVNEQCTI